MKITKTASGKRTLKLSRKEWSDIGKKAGWLQNLDDWTTDTMRGAVDAFKPDSQQRSSPSPVGNVIQDNLIDSFNPKSQDPSFQRDKDAQRIKESIEWAKSEIKNMRGIDPSIAEKYEKPKLRRQLDTMLTELKSLKINTAVQQMLKNQITNLQSQL